MSHNKIENTETGAGPKPRRKKRMSERQLAANRANARKCTGPTSAAGKARSRFNSLKHGLCASNVCLPGDDVSEYERRRQEYINHYQPANLVEWDLVEDIVASRWRKNRLAKFEQCLILDAVARGRLTIHERYHELSLDAETALAVRDLIDQSGSLRLLDRYENRIQRNIVTSTRLLLEAQQNRPPVQDGPESALESETYVPLAPETFDLPTETIPTDEHTVLASVPGPELAPIGNATRPSTIVPKPNPINPKPAVMAAGASRGPAVDASLLAMIADVQPLTAARQSPQQRTPEEPQLAI